MVGTLNGYLSIWSPAYATFGQGTPGQGAQFDQSGRLLNLSDRVASAAPGSAWTGSGADRYANANIKHANTLGALGNLDNRLGTEIDRSAAVVSSGRRDLEAVRKWVVDAAATLPNTAAGQRMLYPIVSKGAKDIQDIVNRSHGDMSAIASRIRNIGSEYDGLGRDDGHDGRLLDVTGDKVPDSTLDLDDIKYQDPQLRGPFGYMELVPHSGVWVPDPNTPGYRPHPPKAPLDYNDIQYYPQVPGQPRVLVPSGLMELVPGSGAWVPDPNYPGFQQRTPAVPVDLRQIQLVDPKALVPNGYVELWPHAGILIPNPNMGQPF